MLATCGPCIFADETAPAISDIDRDVYKTLLESTKAIPRRIVSSPVSVSLGVGTTQASAGSERLAFVERVDKLLYQAKHNGRMRAEYADFRTEL